MADDNQTRLFTTSFVLICLAAISAFVELYILVAALPIYVATQLGGQRSEIGFVMGSFSVAAVLTNIAIGRQLDRHGRKRILAFGTIGFALLSLLYLYAASVPLMLPIRFLHGAAWAVVFATLNTIVSDAAPPHRRGEAIGYFGVSTNIAMAVGPALGITLIQTYGAATPFITAAILGAIAFIAALGVRETLPRRPACPASSKKHISRASKKGIDLLPAMIMLAVSVGYGSVMYFLPVYALSRNIENPGLFFIVFAASLILTRTIAGRASDSFGRSAVIIPGIVIFALSTAALAFADNLTLLLLAAVLFGAGYGSVQPALMALAADRVDISRRGVAMGYFSAALELGIGIGGMVMGTVAQLAGFTGMYLVTGAIAVIGLIILVFVDITRKADARVEIERPVRQ